MFDDAKPIFLQLAEQLSGEILQGRYREGDQVPSTNELAAFHRINPATAGKALNLLVDDSVLVKRRGIGMFVADGATGRIASARREGFVRDYVDPLVKEAHSLGIHQEELMNFISISYENRTK